ncbi:hypothetical protein [Nocardiopsis trehalosi]|uniref:hypothetical protein n=1 Tax=Nocardiopsis trehalosi TaxID=109329 RepID=UPI000835F52A|nr:hypothetical protein [Nocardiopsis trehalosi]
MVVDAVRAYLDAASGLTELTRKRAVAAAKTLLRAADDRAPGTRGTDAAEGAAGAPRVGATIQTLATDLIETSRANREALDALVRAEVEQVLGRLDLVRRDDYDRLARRVAELERRLAQRAPAARSAGAPAPVQPADVQAALRPTPGVTEATTAPRPAASPDAVPAPAHPADAAAAPTASPTDAPDTAPEPADAAAGTARDVGDPALFTADGEPTGDVTAGAAEDAPEAPPTDTVETGAEPAAAADGTPPSAEAAPAAAGDDGPADAESAPASKKASTPRTAKAKSTAARSRSTAKGTKRSGGARTKNGSAKKTD